MRYIKIYEDYKNKMTIKKFVRTEKAFEILDETDAKGSTYSNGGCWILADALSMYFDLPIYVAYNKTWKQIDHFMIKIKGNLIDSDGSQTYTDIINKIREELNANVDIEILPYDKTMNSENIIKNLNASNKLVELMKKYNINL